VRLAPFHREIGESLKNPCKALNYAYYIQYAQFLYIVTKVVNYPRVGEFRQVHQETTFASTGDLEPMKVLSPVSTFTNIGRLDRIQPEPNGAR